MSLVRSIADNFKQGRTSWDDVDSSNMKEIGEEISKALGIDTEVFDETFEEVRSTKAFHTEKNLARFVAATVRLAGKRNDQPRTYRHVIEAIPGDLTANEVSRGYKRICREIGEPIKPAPVTDYVDHLLDRVEAHDEITVTHELKRDATLIAEMCNEDKHLISSGSDPSTLAAGSIYIAGVVNGVEELTQARLEEATLVSDATIRSNYQKIKEHIDEEREETPWMANETA